MGINKKYLEAAMSSDFFKDVDERVVRRYMISDYLYKARKNENIIDENTEEKFLGVILKGKTTTKANVQSDEVILSDDQVSNVIGKSLIFSNENKSDIEVVSLTNTVYLKLSEDDVRELSLKYPIIYTNVMNIMNDSIHTLLKKIKGYTAKSAEKKLALYIKEQLGESNTFTLDVSLSKLAVMLDLGRASLYRAIDTLENNNVILRNKKQIKAVDIKKLNKLCED
ncbi:MAG: hypothetical protein MJ232_02115 [archaeon]|nr:hypothetical protein [archaeon]